MTESERLILVAVLAGVMIAVVLFEMRVMRRKSKEIRRASQKKDEAYNDMLTTRSVMNALRNQGKDTGNAQEFLDRAKTAMNRGEHDRCMEYCSKARSQLTRPSKVPVAGEGESEEDADRLEEVAEEILSDSMPPASPDTYKGTKLSTSSDGNYFGAKFEISAAKADIAREAKSGHDVSSAETLMAQAESDFTSGKYDRALSCAVRARKAIRKDVSEDTIALKSDQDEARPEPATEPEVYDVEEEATPSGTPCPNCGTLLDPNDKFCGKCGTKFWKVKICKSCGSKAKPEDIYCRKCGARIV